MLLIKKRNDSLEVVKEQGLSLSARLYLAFKRLMYPGCDIAIRDRLKLARYFKIGDVQTLDAGCGNGAFSFCAYRLGNHVTSISIDSEAIARCRRYANYVGVSRERVKFLVWNIYDVLELGQTFDQIICFETLEHLQRDEQVIVSFANILNPGGLLHLCTPYRGRPPMFGEFVTDMEDGGHVRFGYTLEELEALVVKAGLKPVMRDKVGGFGQIHAAEIQCMVQKHFTSFLPNISRQLMHVGLFWMLRPLLIFDKMAAYPPMSVYIMAEKQARNRNLV